MRFGGPMNVGTKSNYVYFYNALIFSLSANYNTN